MKDSSNKYVYNPLQQVISKIPLMTASLCSMETS